MTLRGGGIITRVVVAEVLGHGSSVAEFSSMLPLGQKVDVYAKVFGLKAD